jgi:plasmid stabilization system protein ParE
MGAAFLWYQERNPQAADSFRAEALESIDALAVTATQWKQDNDGTRRSVLRHLPYTICYEIDSQTVFVLAVAHQRRAPGYWRAR